MCLCIETHTVTVFSQTDEQRDSFYPYGELEAAAMSRLQRCSRGRLRRFERWRSQGPAFAGVSVRLRSSAMRGRKRAASGLSGRRMDKAQPVYLGWA